jgi:hypothetical protein
MNITDEEIKTVLTSIFSDNCLQDVGLLNCWQERLRGLTPDVEVDLKEISGDDRELFLALLGAFIVITLNPVDFETRQALVHDCFNFIRTLPTAQLRSIWEISDGRAVQFVAELQDCANFIESEPVASC